MKPLTREEVLSWPALGPMGLDPARVLALLDERDRALGRGENLAGRLAATQAAALDALGQLGNPPGPVDLATYGGDPGHAAAILRAALDGHGAPRLDLTDAEIQGLARVTKERDAARAENARLREALDGLLPTDEEFAELENVPDRERGSLNVAAGTLRKARAALSETAER